MYIEANANHQNFQKLENRSIYVIQPSLLHDNLHGAENCLCSVVLLVNNPRTKKNDYVLFRFSPLDSKR